MHYTILILRSAQKELAELPSEIFIRVRDAIRTLGEEPRPSGCVKLSDREGWRIRIGNYRIIYYEIDDAQQTLTVIHIGHRRDVYR